ncbi:hypothetical protein ACFSQZ_10080 [Rubritalea spongiae]|uniref:Signal transduction histidine kinase subgroup 3 dimerisation and phosphoacceptor domain-containing protein n=2 Tax=Rubritalea spongiae TaxID=430797 RepID=A0ABW5E328_9BACT
MQMTLAAGKGEEVSDKSLGEIEMELTEIDDELEKLANFTLRGGVGSLGYRSKVYTEPTNEHWIEINLEHEVLIDQVVLVPCLWRDTSTGVRSEGFPKAFRVVVGTEDESHEVASFHSEDGLLPRIAPLVVSFKPQLASWVRIEISEMSLLINGLKYVVQLSEILVFSGAENVALQRVAIAGNEQGSRRVPSLTDGFTPYLMDAAKGELSQTRVMGVLDPSSAPTITVDLGEAYLVNQINLHTAHVALSIPMKTLGARSVPRHVRVSGAQSADFSDEVFLCAYQQRTLLDNGPVIMRRFEETLCRYIRLTIVDYRPVASLEGAAAVVAFSEIEVLTKGRNVALGADIVMSSNLGRAEDGAERMTDGLNYYGKILPEKEWMGQLARRHDLETLRPIVAKELSLRYERQKRYLSIAIWAAVIMGAGIGFSLLIVRYSHLKNLAAFKERFAADLHDELGANLHTIGLLSDLAEVSKESPEELSGYLERIRVMTERSGYAVQHVTTLNESSALFSELVTDMKRSSERILTQLEHDFSVEGEEYLSRLKPRTSVDLFLFYKECLVNTCRHSNATELKTRLVATAKEVSLSIEDNGKGIEQSYGVPKSLRRRARLLKAKLNVENSVDGGISISLKLRNGK